MSEEEVLYCRAKLTIEVKAYDQDTDLVALSERIRKLDIYGVEWDEKHQLVDIAFGRQKLVMVCHTKPMVNYKEICEKIEGWEEVFDMQIVKIEKLEGLMD